MDEADPQILAIQSALPQLASVLKHDFVPYLSSVMETLMADAIKSVDMKVVTAKEAELENADDDESGGNEMKKMTLSIRGVEGPLQIHMNTAVLENKISALTIIKSLAHTLGPLMSDYVDTIANLFVTELMHNQISSHIRKIATKTLSLLLMSAKDREQMKKLMVLYLPGFASSLKVYLERLDFNTTKWLTLELSRCVKHFYNFKNELWLSDQYAIEMLDLLSKIVETVQLDKAERLSQF